MEHRLYEFKLLISEIDVDDFLKFYKEMDI